MCLGFLGPAGVAALRQLPRLFGSRLGRALVLRVEVLLERGTQILVLTRRGHTIAQHPLFHRVDRILGVGLGIVRSLGTIRLRPSLVVCAFFTGHDNPFVGKLSCGCHDRHRRGNDGDPMTATPAPCTQF
jgi:hypothetical protein